jgi:hypothetical protein
MPTRPKGCASLALALVLMAGPGLPQGRAADAPAGPAAENPLECYPSGYELIVVNRSDQVVPAGTAFVWEVPLAAVSGRKVLEADLAPGARVIYTAAMEATYFARRAPCTIALD